MRKLVVNFLEHAHVETTLARGKAMKQRLDHVVFKMKTRSEQNTIYLKQYFPDRKTIEMLFDQVGKAIATIDGGYVRIVRLNRRLRDGAMMVRVEWAHPIVIDWDSLKPKKTVKAKEASDTKIKDSKNKKAESTKKVDAKK
ncbi:MAG: hypothetical protein O3B87_00185 [bacterium]|nr:hypothetical protein [bacterium]